MNKTTHHSTGPAVLQARAYPAAEINYLLHCEIPVVTQMLAKRIKEQNRPTPALPGDFACTFMEPCLTSVRNSLAEDESKLHVHTCTAICLALNLQACMCTCWCLFLLQSMCDGTSHQSRCRQNPSEMTDLCHVGFVHAKSERKQCPANPTQSFCCIIIRLHWPNKTSKPTPPKEQDQQFHNFYASACSPKPSISNSAP